MTHNKIHNSLKRLRFKEKAKNIYDEIKYNRTNKLSENNFLLFHRKLKISTTEQIPTSSENNAHKNNGNSKKSNLRRVKLVPLNQEVLEKIRAKSVKEREILVKEKSKKAERNQNKYNIVTTAPTDKPNSKIRILPHRAAQSSRDISWDFLALKPPKNPFVRERTSSMDMKKRQVQKVSLKLWKFLITETQRKLC